MKRHRDDDRIDHTGVGNTSVSQLQEAIDASEAPILTNQVECQPLNGRGDLLESRIGHDVTLTAYSPVAGGRILGNETLHATGDRRPVGNPEAQVAPPWLLEQDAVSPIPTASDPDHRNGETDAFEFELTDEEMSRVLSSGRPRHPSPGAPRDVKTGRTTVSTGDGFPAALRSPR